jgi:hypothetical protein
VNTVVLTTTSTTTILSESAARELVDTIKKTVRIVESQIVRAYHGRAWEALGYGTWDEMCETEFDGARIRLPREQRQTTIGSLADAGLSTRAIASVTGLGRSTVARDLAGDPNGTPDPAGVITESHEARPGQRHDGTRPSEAPPITKVTGLDGKTYPATKPKAKPIDADRHPMHKGRRHIYSHEVLRRTSELNAGVSASDSVLEMVDLTDDAITELDIEEAISAAHDAIRSIRAWRRRLEFEARRLRPT